MVTREDGNGPDDFPAWSDRIEKRLRAAAKWLAVLLIAAQLALQVPAIRHWITATDDSKGIPLRESGR
ncbi:hypothetical protein ACF3MZ_06875 [Paenibacillaceae bacterium WGS1546]|uniref:hypothetical protein n=1 Tax=Cohnella sp. WGS1546 TaxID=3366810 RepID=UPI00372D8261